MQTLPALAIISGTSGAGKTLLVENLKHTYGCGQVSTVTTRPPAQGETEKDYFFVSVSELRAMEARGETLWVIERYGYLYSITEGAIRLPFSVSDIAFVIITPDYHVAINKWCHQHGIAPINFHLFAPEISEQVRRLIERDGEGFNRERVSPINNATFVADASDAAEKIDLHYIYQGSPEKMSNAVQRIIDTAHAQS